MKKDVLKLQPNIYMWTEDRKGKSGYTFWKAVYSDYAMIPFEMEPVKVCALDKMKRIDEYEDLKEWWEDEK